jgi:signal peptidase II
MFLLGLDQLSKGFIESNFFLGEKLELIPSIIELIYVRNTGAAWSILSGHKIFFILVAIIASIALAFFIWKNFEKSKLLIVALSLILTGALGNLLDRIFHGFVIDWIQLAFINFPIFNGADIFLTCGAGLFLIDVFFDERKNNGKS